MGSRRRERTFHEWHSTAYGPFDFEESDKICIGKDSEVVFMNCFEACLALNNSCVLPVNGEPLW